MLARSMARRTRPIHPLEQDDLEQAALAMLLQRLPAWDECRPFEWFAWHSFRAGIAEAQLNASWRRNGAARVDRDLVYGFDLSPIAALEALADEVDGCVICGAAMPGTLTRGREKLYCSPACRYKLVQLRKAATLTPAGGGLGSTPG